jgi:hypothetical protein
VSDERAEFLFATHDPILNTIIWNAPDHEHTRLQLRAWLEEAITEAFAVYDIFGGDAAVVAPHLLEQASAGRSSGEAESPARSRSH